MGCMDSKCSKAKNSEKPKNVVEPQVTQKIQKTQVSSSKDEKNSVIQIQLECYMESKSMEEENTSVKNPSTNENSGKNSLTLSGSLTLNSSPPQDRNNKSKEQMYGNQIKGIIQLYGKKYPLDSDNLRETQIFTTQNLKESSIMEAVNKSGIEDNWRGKKYIQKLSVISEESGSVYTEEEEKVTNSKQLERRSYHVRYFSDYNEEKVQQERSFRRQNSILRVNH